MYCVCDDLISEPTQTEDLLFFKECPNDDNRKTINSLQSAIMMLSRMFNVFMHQKANKSKHS